MFQCPHPQSPATLGDRIPTEQLPDLWAFRNTLPTFPDLKHKPSPRRRHLMTTTKQLLDTVKLSRSAPIHAKCDFCGSKAIVDAPTTHGSSWAHMCCSCLDSYGRRGWPALAVRLLPDADGK